MIDGSLPLASVGSFIRVKVKMAINLNKIPFFEGETSSSHQVLSFFENDQISYYHTVLFHINPCCIINIKLNIPPFLNPDLVASLDEVLPTLKASDISLWTVDHSAPCDGFNSLLDKLDKVSEEPLPDPPKVNVMSNFLFIFTSGTTGKVLSIHIIR